MQQPTRERGDSLEEFAIGDISVLGDDGFCVRLARSMFLEDSIWREVLAVEERPRGPRSNERS